MTGDQTAPELAHRLYPKSYGAWGGNPSGTVPNYLFCCVAVRPSGRWPVPHQCRKPRGHGPDGAYCKQHDPVVVKAREDARDARGAEKWKARLYEVYGKKFYETLVKIADGHNDARGLAQEVINASGLSDHQRGDR
jgi:hypothetical protein